MSATERETTSQPMPPLALIRCRALLATAVLGLLALSWASPAQAGPGSSNPEVGLPAPVPCPGCWIPPAEVSWQWQITGTVNQRPKVAVFDIDGFDNSAAVVAALHAKGAKVFCYLDAGTREIWRPDARAFP